MSPSTIYLISGANRGIGFGLVAHILATQTNAFVYAGARKPENASALRKLQQDYPDRVCIVKCVSGDIEGNAELAKEIETRHGYLDTLIGNAGISGNLNYAIDTTLSELEEHFHVNVFGHIILFQGVYNLLKKSSKPRFVPISSVAACFNGVIMRAPNMGCVCYGASKAALNWATRKIHFENDWLIAFPLSPGAVETDMFHTNLPRDVNRAMESLIPEALPQAADAAVLLIKVIDESTREKHGGEFMHVDGSRLPW